MKKDRPAYLLVDTAIKNVHNYEEYKKLALPIVKKFDGEYLVRGGNMEIVQNELWSPTRIVLIKFPNYRHKSCFFYILS